jgi:hypothetical protein
MARPALLKPYCNKKGQWVVDIPATVNPTGRRRRIFCYCKEEALRRLNRFLKINHLGNHDTDN